MLPKNFYKHVEKTEDGCWLWVGANVKGYGHLFVNGAPRYAHRLMWEEVNGPIPEGQIIIRTCGQRSCVRPEHLKLTSRYGFRSGANHPRAKLTPEQVELIRAWKPLPELAKELGVSRQTAYSIRAGKIWKNQAPAK